MLGRQTVLALLLWCVCFMLVSCAPVRWNPNAPYGGRWESAGPRGPSSEEILEQVLETQMMEKESRNRAFSDAFGAARRHMKSGDYEQALAKANFFMEYHTLDPRGRGMRGDICFEQGQYDKAIKEYSKGLSLPYTEEPFHEFYEDRTALYIRRGLAYCNQGKHQQGIKDIQEARGRFYRIRNKNYYSGPSDWNAYYAVVNLARLGTGSSNTPTSSCDHWPRDTTRLHTAVRMGDKDVEQLLAIARAVNINERNRDGETALQIAIESGQRSIAVKLIEWGADINGKGRYDHTPLYSAAWERDESMVRLLIDKGADVNIGNILGNTPLHYAVNFNRPALVELLLANGADVNAKNDKGITPLQMAREEGKKEMVKLLKRYSLKK